MAPAKRSQITLGPCGHVKQLTLRRVYLMTLKCNLYYPFDSHVVNRKAPKLFHKSQGFFLILKLLLVDLGVDLKTSAVLIDQAKDSERSDLARTVSDETEICRPLLQSVIVTLLCDVVVAHGYLLNCFVICCVRWVVLFLYISWKTFCLERDAHADRDGKTMYCLGTKTLKCYNWVCLAHVSRNLFNLATKWASLKITNLKTNAFYKKRNFGLQTIYQIRIILLFNYSDSKMAFIAFVTA